MAVDEYDPVTGSPIFKDTGAPDVGVDPTEAAKYAARVGNRIMGANLAALNAYAYKRKGLKGVALDTLREYTHDGSAWKLDARGEYLIQRIPFTAVTSVSFTGFTGDFADYFAILDINTSSAASGGTIRLRSGTTDNAAAVYTTQQDWADGTGMSASRAVNQTSFPGMPIPGSEHTLKIDFIGPFLTRPTRLFIDAQTWVTPTDGKKSQGTGRHNASTSFDGFSYIASTGNITGSLSVYGRA